MIWSEQYGPQDAQEVGEGGKEGRRQADGHEAGPPLQAATLRSRRPTATPPCRPTSRPCRAGRRDVGRRLDALIVRTVPGVRKAVKWNSPLLRRRGPRGWFLGIHCFTKYVKVAFFRGASLRPVPPGESKSKDVRYLDIHEDDQFDEAQFAAWVKQASQLPGERM